MDVCFANLKNFSKYTRNAGALGWTGIYLESKFIYWRNDKIPQVRLQWIDLAGAILKNYKSANESLFCKFLLSNLKGAALESKLLDPDERIRQFTLKKLGEMNHAAFSLVSDSFLRKILDRCKDKKVLFQMFSNIRA